MNDVSLGLAAALEVGKALAIVWYRFSSDLYPTPMLGKIISTSFRIGLIVLSLLCTLLFLANFLDKPALEKTMSADRLDMKTRHEEEMTRLQKTVASQRQRLSESHRKSLQQIDALYLPRIVALRSDLSGEMDNVIRGTFRGPRYQEFERLLAIELERQRNEVQKNTAEFNVRMAQLNTEASDYQKALEQKQLGEKKALSRVC